MTVINSILLNWPKNVNNTDLGNCLMYLWIESETNLLALAYNLKFADSVNRPQ